MDGRERALLEDVLAVFGGDNDDSVLEREQGGWFDEIVDSSWARKAEALLASIRRLLQEESSPVADIVCEACEEHGGFEGELPELAEYRVAITAPAGPVKANKPKALCISHAAREAETIVRFGWGVEVTLLDPSREAQLRPVEV